MNDYQRLLCEHLGQYKTNRLGVNEKGTWRGIEYAHILPEGFVWLNLLEPIRSEFQQYLRNHPEIKLHKGFGHLNSSQSFAFNLFYPYFSSGGTTARSLSCALGIDANIHPSNWEFEQVQHEGTNVDVVWETDDGRQVFCEVKLSEAEFGMAASDKRHLERHKDIYCPTLRGFVSEELLEEKLFFKHYQLLRNLSLITQEASRNLVILLPRANVSLQPQLQRFLTGLSENIQPRIHVAYVEDVIFSLEDNPSIPSVLRGYAGNLREKYIPS